MKGELVIADDPGQLAARVADFIADCAQDRHDFRLVLAGGSTPIPLYQLLSMRAFRERIDWHRVSIFFGDERWVPHDDPRSNYRMARETLLSHAPILINHIHPIPTDGTPYECARRYEALLHDIYGASMLDPARPLFDLVLLGLGGDGHTASLFPASPALEANKQWVVAVMRDDPRITLTYPALESSAAVAFLVTGAEKANALRAARAGELPAGKLNPVGKLIWFADRAAAGT